jgi:hypothetical protein
MNWTKKKYKSIYISECENICLLHFSDSYNHDEVSFITSLSYFVEYIGYKMPQFVIIEKTKANFNTLLFSSFLKKTIDDLMRSGVVEVYFIVSHERYLEIQSSRTNGVSSYCGIKAFLDLESCLTAIKKN